MADEPVTTDATVTTDKMPVSAGFDPKAIEGMVQGAVRSSIESFVKEAQAKRAEAEAAQQAEEAAKARPSGLDDMFRPHLEPALKAARDAEARAMLAADSAEFYTDPKNAEAAEFRPKIEEVVMAQAKRGNLITRKDAWYYLRGGELHEGLQTKRAEAYAAKIKEAQSAEAAGPSIQVPKFAKPIEDLNTDELGQALKNVRF